MADAGRNFFNDLVQDLRGIVIQDHKQFSLSSVLWCIFATDAFSILLIYRIRRLCFKYKIPFANRLLRFLHLALYGIEISVEAELGHGVYFVHPVGIVIGGNSRVGDLCMFLGSNTLGTKNGGYPQLGSGVLVGAGARVLDGVRIGDGCKIGANAVVVSDAPPKSTVVGIPGRFIPEIIQP